MYCFWIVLRKGKLCAWWLSNHWKHYLEAQFILQLVMFWHFFLILIFLGIELFSAQRAKFSPEEKTKCLRIDWLQMGKHQFLKTTILPSRSQCLFYVQLYTYLNKKYRTSMKEKKHKYKNFSSRFWIEVQHQCTITQT